MGGEAHTEYRCTVFLVVEGAQTIVVIFHQRLGQPDNLVKVVDALELRLHLFGGKTRVALAHLGVFDGDKHAPAVKLTIAALGHEIGVNHIVDAQ